ncbi:MAG: hypothetical protein WBB99_08355 [Rhodococcus sp. (in: high G+C Gram-positive bacteria)]
MRTPVTLLLAASLVLGGCASDPLPEAPTSPQEVRFASGSIGVGTSIPPPETHDARMDAVRIDDGQVVLTFAGDGTVNYVGWYVDEARPYNDTARPLDTPRHLNDTARPLDTAQPLEVPGASILQLDLISSAAPSEAEKAVRPTSDGDISVRVAAPQDGVVQVFVGIAADRPEFTVSTGPDELTATFAN